MARQVYTKMIDDLDGEEATETVSFALDGTGYEIDLSGAHGLELRRFLERYMLAGTRVGRVTVAGGPRARQANHTGTASVRNSREENSNIREWAASNGHTVNERGRIPQTVVDAYHKAKTTPLVPATPAPKAASPKAVPAPPKAAPAVSFKPEVSPARRTTRRPGRTGANVS